MLIIRAPPDLPLVPSATTALVVGSPQLLMLSGIGPKAHLRDVGIDPIVYLPGVGSNLHDPPMGGVVYTASRPAAVEDSARGGVRCRHRGAGQGRGQPTRQTAGEPHGRARIPAQHLGDARSTHRGQARLTVTPDGHHRVWISEPGNVVGQFLSGTAS